MAYAEDEPEEDTKKTLMFFGSDLSKIPCFRESHMVGIGSGLVAGLGYNLFLSRNPFKIALGTYGLVMVGFYARCRYMYRMQEHDNKKLRYLMQRRNTFEGTAEEREFEQFQENLNKSTEN